MSVNKHHVYKGFWKTLHSSIEAKLYQFELKAVLVVFLPRHRSVTVKEIGKAGIIAVCIRNFMKENNLMAVKNTFIIIDPSK